MNRRIIATVLSIFTAFTLAMTSAAPAQAAPKAPVQQLALPAGPESCAAVFGSIPGGAFGLVVMAVSGPFCANWGGKAIADYICWQTRHGDYHSKKYWGAWVKQITHGKYKRC